TLTVPPCRAAGTAAAESRRRRVAPPPSRDRRHDRRRAGTTTATAFGDKLGSKQANVKNKPYNGGEEGPSLGKATKVGSYPANPWGLHDMHGNIVEWCRDWYHAKLPGGADPDLYSVKATAQKNRTGDWSRVRRGGAWTDAGWACRSAFRLR